MSRRVMVIYGRDEANCSVVCDYLESLGLQPTTFAELLGRLAARWGEDGPPAEALVAAVDRCQAAVILMTPDDEARMGSHLCFGVTDAPLRRVRGQARAGVYFEAGIAAARLPGRTTVLELGMPAAAPSDPNLGASLRASPDGFWQEPLFARLKDAGCPLPPRPVKTARKFHLINRRTTAAVMRLGFDDVEAALDSVIEQVKSWRTPDCIIGVEQGGGVVAGMLGQHFGLDSVATLDVTVGRTGENPEPRWRSGSEPEGLDDKRSTLVVGDVLRRDSRMLGAREFLYARVRPELRTATLASACATAVLSPDKHARPIPDFLGITDVSEGGVLMPWEPA